MNGVDGVFASSGTLARQIEGGAPADIFISANPKWSDYLIEKGIEGAIDNKTVTYDLERQMDGATLLSCSAFGKAIVENM